MPATSRAKCHIAVLAALVAVAIPASAQDDLRQINQNTRVGSVSFRFQGRHVMTAERLEEQMVTQGPTFMDRLRKRLDFLPWIEPNRHLFSPIELQRDMARLRRFYERNGFLEPRIDYPATQLNTSSNRIRVIVNVDEGPPLTVTERTVRFSAERPEEFEEAWERELDRASLKAGSRYTDFERIQLESRLRAFWRDRGYAFADIATELAVDSSASNVQLIVRPELGPPARVDTVIIEGIESVSRRVVARELPFSKGDLYSSGDLTRGQRSLFELNLFRVALVEVPEQPVDSTVTIRVRLREAEPRYVEAQTGYSREVGATVGATLRHRNFFGGARQFSLSGSGQTGLFASPPAGRVTVRDYNAGVSVSQPYFFRRNLSAQLSLSVSLQDDPNQDNRFRTASLTPLLLYKILPFRSVSLQYRLSQSEPLNQTTSLVKLGIFSRDVIATSVTIGRLNDYLNPRRGWIIRPSAELAGTAISRDMQYTKGQIEASAYVPVTRRSSFALNLKAGRLIPAGPSRDQSDPQTEFRFDDVRFYAGGASDVRGWGLNLIGPQVARADTVIAESDGTYSVVNPRYEAVGGLGKLAGSVEFLFPAPFLSSSWKAGTFVDFGGLSSAVERGSDNRILVGEDNLPTIIDRVFPKFSDLRWAAGAGLRLLTPVGAIRLDLAYKLNPTGTDLHRPSDELLFNRGLAPEPERRPIRRLNFHISIQRAF